MDHYRIKKFTRRNRDTFYVIQQRRCYIFWDFLDDEGGFITYNLAKTYKTLVDAKNALLGIIRIKEANKQDEIVREENILYVDPD